MPRHSRCLLNKALHTLLCLKFELTNHDSEGGKTCTVLTSIFVQRKGIEVWQLLSMETALNIYGKGFTITKTITDYEKRKIGNILCLQPFNLVPNRAEIGSPVSGSPLVARRVWPCRITVLSFWTKHAAPCLIKPSIRRCQRNLSIVFIFISYKEKDSYHVTPVGQLTFACCSYCGHSHRMQGGYNWLL